MNSTKLTNVLLLLCAGMLGLIAFRAWNLPTIEQIDSRIQLWGQHYGTHFSSIAHQTLSSTKKDNP